MATNSKRQTAIVTGAGGGIGSGIVEQFVTAGWNVVLNDVRADTVLAVGAGLSVDQALGVVADVTTRDGAELLCQRAIERFGEFDALVNVVGGMHGPLRRDFMSINDHQWDFAMNINLRSTFQSMQAALRHMIPRRVGRIVNIASTAWAGSPDHADYAAAKAGVVALTRSVATQVGRHDITVNAVAPGLTLTSRVLASSAFDTDDVPLQRANQPSDVADAVLFLCSDGARNISGQLLTVAGGLNPSL